MVPPPWKVDCNRDLYAVKTNTSITNCMDGFEIAKENADAIVLAINNTYGVGVNPEAVKDMFNALKEAKRMYQKLQPAGGWQGVYDSITGALEKAKMKC